MCSRQGAYLPLHVALAPHPKVHQMQFGQPRKALADKAPKIAIHAQPVFAMEVRFDPCLNGGLEGRDAYCRPSY